MDQIGVLHSGLTEILNELKNQSIGVKIQNKSGQWSESFYTIEDIQDFSHKQFKLTAMVLCNPVDMDSTIIDIQSIVCIELREPFLYRGNTYRRIKIS